MLLVLHWTRCYVKTNCATHLEKTNGTTIFLLLGKIAFIAKYFMFQAILEADCASPIEGQYVTVQKYAHLPDADNINEIIEIDVEVYCGPFVNLNGNIETCIIDEPDDACTRKSWIAGKSKFFVNKHQKS